MLGDSGRTERGAERYLPFTGHIGPQTVLLDNGSLLAVPRQRFRDRIGILNNGGFRAHRSDEGA